MSWNPFKKKKKPESDLEVVVVENPPVFQLKGEIMLLDDGNIPANGDRTKCKVSFENPVSVFSDDGRLLGAARLYQEGKALMAEMFLDYATPERLDIENGVKYYLWNNGHDTVTGAKIGNHLVILSSNIQSLMLQKHAPNDKRINNVK